MSETPMPRTDFVIPSWIIQSANQIDEWAQLTGLENWQIGPLASRKLVWKLERELADEKAGHPGEHALHDEPMDRQVMLLNRQVAALHKELEEAKLKIKDAQFDRQCMRAERDQWKGVAGKLASVLKDFRCMGKLSIRAEKTVDEYNKLKGESK